MPAYGRIPSPPDKRDFNLEHFLTTDDPLTQLMNAVLAAKGANPAVKAWVQAATPRIIGTPIPPAPTPTNTTSWDNPRPVLDQGQFGTCVGNGWAQWGNTSPVNDNYNEDDARAIYLAATVFDGQADTTYQVGSTVRSGAKAMQQKGRLTVYAFANTVDVAVAWLQQKGPVVFGTDFTADMENPDSTGLIHPTGSVMGGHCYKGDGYDPSTDLIRFQNSWGNSWGVDDGHFYMSKSEFTSLFADQGEACTAIELAL